MNFVHASSAPSLLGTYLILVLGVIAVAGIFAYIAALDSKRAWLRKVIATVTLGSLAAAIVVPPLLKDLCASGQINLLLPVVPPLLVVAAVSIAFLLAAVIYSGWAAVRNTRAMDVARGVAYQRTST